MFPLRRKATIIVLVIYWPAIFVLTHIPIPQLVRQAGVSDKGLHFVVFLILTFLLWFSISPDKRINWRKASAWLVVLAIAGYGAADELLQNYFGRNGTFADFLADSAGAVAGLAIFSFFSFWSALLVVTGSAIFVLTNVATVNPAELLPVTARIFYLTAYGFFSLVWIRYMNESAAPKASKLKWLVTAFVLPTGLLLTVKVLSVVIGREFGGLDVTMSLAGIALAVLAVALISAFRRNLAEKA